MIITTRINEYIQLERILRELKEISQRESKKPMDCTDLTPSMLSLLDDEIIPMLENELDYDPTPQHLYDNSGGEPPVTMSEMWTQAHHESQLFKS